MVNIFNLSNFVIIIACRQPLGFQNGAIAADQVECNTYFAYSECASTCSQVRYAEGLYRTFQCYKSAYFKITFPQTTVLTGILVDVMRGRTDLQNLLSYCFDCSIQKFKIIYSKENIHFEETQVRHNLKSNIIFQTFYKYLFMSEKDIEKRLF